MFEMGKACFSRKQGRKLVESPPDFPRVFDDSIRTRLGTIGESIGKAACRLINVEPFMGVATEGHLSGFLNYLVRKFPFVEFRFEWEKGFRKFCPAERRSPMRHVLLTPSWLNFSLGTLFIPLIFLASINYIVPTLRRGEIFIHYFFI